MARIKSDLVNGTSGKVGEQFLYKTRKGKTFISKVPDMSQVIATNEQTKNRNIFGEAVKYAAELKNDPVRAETFNIKKGESLYLAAVREYMRMHGHGKADKSHNSRFSLKHLLKAGLTDRQVNFALHIMKTGSLSNGDCQRMNNISKPTATRDLKVLADKKIIESNGVRGAGASYKMGSWWSTMGS